jgi:hypothetical protein
LYLWRNLNLASNGYDSNVWISNDKGKWWIRIYNYLLNYLSFEVHFNNYLSLKGLDNGPSLNAKRLRQAFIGSSMRLEYRHASLVLVIPGNVHGPSTCPSIFLGLVLWPNSNTFRIFFIKPKFFCNTLVFSYTLNFISCK